jgi:hypothetical protein
MRISERAVGLLGMLAGCVGLVLGLLTVAIVYALTVAGEWTVRRRDESPPP